MELLKTLLYYTIKGTLGLFRFTFMDPETLLIVLVLVYFGARAIHMTLHLSTALSVCLIGVLSVVISGFAAYLSEKTKK